uniref:Aminotransferase-like plant mobile domain-containing protein n=1 Tax=Fagus sylvatica TaxID=28930 RepID=A0A2N9GDE0_FAGSY
MVAHFSGEIVEEWEGHTCCRYPYSREAESLLDINTFKLFFFLLLLFFFFFSFFFLCFLFAVNGVFFKETSEGAWRAVPPAREVPPLLVVRERRETQGTIAVAPTLFWDHRSLMGTYWVDPPWTRGTEVVRGFLLFRRASNHHRRTGSGWLSERTLQQMWPGLRIFERLEIFRFRGMKCLPCLWFLIFQCSRAVEWADWIDLELADRGFCDRLEQAGVLRSILISRCSNMYRDTEALRQLVRRWCPSTHTFFFAHGELTVTLEDVENHWLLPILGDQGPADLILSPEELEIESALADYIGRKNIALGTQAARFKPWMEHFNRETNPLIRRAAFVAYWLSKCVFGEHPAYSIKPLYFPLAHALEYIRKGRKPYEARNKFASMPEGVVTNVGDFQGDVPAVYRWVGSKFYDHSLIPSLDSESKVCWRPYGVSHRGFVYESVMSGFSNIEAQDYTLIAGDMASLTYLSATNAGWLPVLSSDGLRFTVYSAHRVRKQFGFDQEIPAVMGVAAGEIPTINPFLRTMAFAYWSGVAPRVIIPSGDRIGVYTTGMSNYWRGLMAAMVEFRNSGRGDISHLLESYTSPLPHPRLFMATNTMTTYANRQSLGLCCMAS